MLRQHRETSFPLGSMKKDKVYFISDAHIGAGNAIRPLHIREDALIDFLRAIRQDAEALYIVGDLFDFWFEYRSVVPAHGARVIFELYHLVQRLHARHLSVRQPRSLAGELLVKTGGCGTSRSFL